MRLLSALLAMVLLVSTALAGEGTNSVTRETPDEAPAAKAVGDDQFNETWMTAITNSGILAGAARDPAGAWHAVTWRDGRFTSLDPAGAWRGSVALDANNRGQAVGFGGVFVNFPPPPGVRPRPLLWERGVAVDLMGTSEFQVGVAFAINERGQVAIAASRRLIPFPVCHALLWEEGRLTDLGPADVALLARIPLENTHHFLGLEINERGDVIGDVGTQSFFWRDGVRTELPFRAVDLNNRGQVVGESFMWEDGKLTELLTTEGEPILAQALNDRGEVAGYGPIGPLRWHNRRIEPLYFGSSAADINARGQIVGTYNLGFPFPFSEAWLWDGDGAVDLGSMLPPGPSRYFVEPRSVRIDDAGRVLLNALDYGRQTYLIESSRVTRLVPTSNPVPAPSGSPTSGVPEEQVASSVNPSSSAGAGPDFARVTPNPAIGPVQVLLSLPSASEARVSVLDVQGRLVRSLAHGHMETGEVRLAWDGQDDAGLATPAGLYFVQVEAGPRVFATRMMRLR